MLMREEEKLHTETRRAFIFLDNSILRSKISKIHIYACEIERLMQKGFCWEIKHLIILMITFHIGTEILLQLDYEEKLNRFGLAFV